MGYHNIERNKLDYILTDLLPVEMSELFSLNDFYDYLFQNQKLLNKVISKLRKAKEKNDKVLFQSGWASAPLKFNILKGNNGNREMSVIQPISMINIYLFLELYQKEILIILKENSIYSLRYHTKNNDLYYKKRVKNISEYYYDTSKKVNKRILQQTGAYFKIRPFNSVSSFTSCNKWQELNFKYSDFIRMDYKSCFDSVYTHVYKWISQKNVVDSKNAMNSSLYITIDRLLQNINAKSSNGVVVGPEFSRMIVELLLQQIDIEVDAKLNILGYESSRDYNIYRYVDDIYIFTNESAKADKIMQTITEVAQKYLIKPNELKIFKSKTPFIISNWLSKTRVLADRIANLFYSENELKIMENDNRYLIKDGYLHISQIKNEFNSIICDYPDEKRRVVSYCLSTLLNKISKKKSGFNIANKQKTNKVYYILELALYFHANCPCFEHTQRIISMIVYFNDELDFIHDEKNHQKLQNCLSNYMFIFLKENPNDLCNLFLIFKEYNIVIPTDSEDIIFKRLKKLNNPLLLANYLLYSKYNNAYFSIVLSSVEDIIKSNIEQISQKEEFLQIEFWYVIIFINCPFISSQTRQVMENIVNRIKLHGSSHPSAIITNLICDYLCRRQNNLFFSWGVHSFSVSKQIAFRTYQRSLFREYRKRDSILYGSID